MRVVRIFRHSLRGSVALAALAILFPSAEAPRAADPQPYTVTIAPTGNKALDAALAGSSTLESLRESAPVGPFALIARAQQDRDRFRTALNSFGYYESQVTIRIADKPIDDPSLADALDAAPAQSPVSVTVAIETGPLFHLGQVRVEGAVPETVRDKLGLAPGAPAVASDVLSARSRLLDALRNQGYALASVAEPVAVLDPAHDMLNITYNVTSGPRVDIGPIAINGLDQVNESFVRQRLLIHRGELFDASEVERARQDLANIGVFATVRAVPSTQLDAAGQLPIAFDVTERKRHVVSFGAFYSTDLGVGLTAGWSDRNLFGNAEQLNVTTGFQGGGTAQRSPGYNANIQFVKPDFLARDQQLQADIGAVKQNLQAYDQTATTGDILLNRRFSEHWNGSVGLAAEWERIVQEGITRYYTLLGVPITVRYDSTDSLLEPTRGIRAAASVTPTQSFGTRNVTFVIMQASGATYVDLADFGLTDPGRSIFAFRGLIGDAEGATQFDLPPDKRFYAGGSGTVRGYRYQSVGPHFPISNNPEGGTSVTAGTVEFRQRIVGNYGAAVFVDAGQVAANGPPFTGVWRVGAGVGARYYTSIGPIRLDVAFPLIKQTGSDALEVYIGIGEAF